MILNEKVRCRASAGFWLPVTALGLGLLATPTAAQDPEKVQIEIRVNGKNVDDLSAEERRSLLQKLLGDDAPAKERKPSGQRRTARATDRTADEGAEEAEAKPRGRRLLRSLFDRSGDGGEVTVLTPETIEQVEGGLQRARRLIGDLPEFRGEIVELGEELKGLGKELRLLDGSKARILDLEGRLQDLEVLDLGKGIHVLGDDLRSLEGHVRELGEAKVLLQDGVRLLQQGGKAKRKVGRDDEEDEDDGEGDERGDRSAIGRIVQRALQDAHQTALEEIRGDADLQRLGITKDVERMVERVLSGKDSQDVVRKIVRKAAGSALRDVDLEVVVPELDVVVESVEGLRKHLIPELKLRSGEQVIRVEDLEELRGGKGRYEIKVLDGGDVPEVKFYEVRSGEDAPAKDKNKRKNKDETDAKPKAKVWQLDTGDEKPQPKKRKIV